MAEEFSIQTLLGSREMTLRDIICRGTCRHRSAEECVSTTHLVFPYRGTYVRHVGQDNAVADANQLMLFNQGEGYRISHPISGGDASLSLALEAGLLQELVPKRYVRPGGDPAFRFQRLRIDPRAQALVSLLRHGLTREVAEPLQAETLVLTLVRRALGERTSRAPGSTYGRRRLVDRAKLAISANPARRWKLAEIAAEVGVSPVYLTQSFQQVEGLPLYRYQLRCRLARALDLLHGYGDLSALALDLGFATHSHFTAAFRQLYGCTPAQMQRALRPR
ncbi:MAG TPA: AraC family transcriptional regulator [Steroidobacteraceae bacterium]|nr:AraC family transcriptional regulator [Steroidobacteraceae bacterium]